MKRALVITALLGAGIALTAARPGNEYQLMLQLNGQPVRWQLPDAGPSGLYASGNNMACARLGGSDAGLPQPQQVILLVPEVPLNVCIRPATSTSSPGVPSALQWDGGCNAITRDFNFGTPLQAYLPWYTVLDTSTTQICAVSDGGSVSGSLWLMQ